MRVGDIPYPDPRLNYYIAYQISLSFLVAYIVVESWFFPRHSTYVFKLDVHSKQHPVSTYLIKEIIL